jgi:hypothetical protein
MPTYQPSNPEDWVAPTAEQLRSVYEDPLQEARQRIAELELEVSDYGRLIALQHTRVGAADLLFQQAHDWPAEKFPDLGRLVNWLLEERLRLIQRIGVLERICMRAQGIFIADRKLDIDVEQFLEQRLEATHGQFEDPEAG